MPPIVFFPFTFPGCEALRRVHCAFTTRRGGASRPPFAEANLSYDVGDDPAAVADNRRTLARRLGVNAWCECRQVHGDTLHVDPAPQTPETPATLEGDGLATSRPGAALAIKTADCQPLLLAHASGRFIAALHVGWRGNVLDFPASGVAAFCAAYHLRPADLHAVRGPSLGPDASQFTNFETEFGPAFQPYYHPDTQTVDLWTLTRSQLLAAGLPAEHIHGLDQCTLTHPDLFFSYRRDKTSGRQVGVIWMDE